MSEFVLVEDFDTVRLVTINRPEAKNAMHAPLRAELIDALTATEQDDAIRAVVLTGAGPVFSAGVDFKLHDHPPAREAQFLANPAKAVRSMTKPVIAAVNGACISGGLEVALSCSFIVASKSARFADTHARLGVVATWGLTALLPRAVGTRFATQMSVTGQFVDADEALRVGLVTRVVPDDELVAVCVDLARNVPGNAAVAELLDLYRRGESVGLAGALDLETSTSVTRKVDLAGFTSAGQAITGR
jgi:enoyl-CoA hydratase